MEKRLLLQAEDMRKQIHEELLTSDNEQYVKLAEQVHDSGDESIADLLSDVDIILVDRMIKELRLIESALERIAEGGYGICQECGTEIEHARLDAEPEALRCLPCQEQYDKTHATEPHPSI
jgi:RNA polymerase-binding protein DksA